MSHSLAVRFWEKVDASGPCWVWTGAKTRDGYGQVWVGGEKKYARANRVSWEWFHGPIPAGMLVCHHCDNPSCVRPDHLFLGTDADNAADMVRKGRSPRCPGASNHNATISPERVHLMLGWLRSGVTHATVARHFRVSMGTVSNVATGKHWASPGVA